MIDLVDWMIELINDHWRNKSVSNNISHLFIRYMTLTYIYNTASNKNLIYQVLFTMFI